MSGSQSRETIKTLLVDDEEMALHRLRKALYAYPHITIIGEAKDGPSAIELISSQRPDLVFLDIQMPGFNGIEVLNHLEYTPVIVFVTAYEEYAVKAFEKNSLDYLLKPVEESRLALTMKRIEQNKAGEAGILLKIKQLLNDHKPDNIISTIPVKTGNKIHLVQAADICFFEAKDKYVNMHTKGEVKLIEYPLNYLQDRLPAQFIRISRSYIINKLKVREIHKYFKGAFILVMDDSKGSKLKSASSYNEAIKTKLLLP